jgi:hypothetical protein
MVYSGAKRTSQLASYMNGDFGGGSRKAGLPYQIGRTAAISYAFRQTSQNLIVLKGRTFELNYHLQIAIKNLADKQRLVDEAQTIYDNAEEGSEAQTNALTSLNLAKSERDAAQTVKDNAQTAYDNVVA